MKKIIYTPSLHPALAPQKLPEDVLFICPGLDCGNSSKYFTPSGLPLDIKSARASLEELMQMGASFDKSGDLKLMAGKGWLEQEEERKKRLRGEENALEKFAESGQVPGNEWTRSASHLPSSSPAENFINAQKALLLAWEHEECILAIQELEEKISIGEENLSGILSYDETQSNPQKGLQADKHKIGISQPEYSWKVILDAMGTFLPEHSIIFTAFTPMISDLHSAGVLEPLPGNMAELLNDWPETLVASLLSARLPLWRLLGYASLPQERPWLAATYDLLAAPKLD